LLTALIALDKFSHLRIIIGVYLDRVPGN